MLNSTFSRLQYGSIFIHLAVVASQIRYTKSREIRQKFELIAVQGHPRSSLINLDANQKHICDFLLVINSNFVRISYHFRVIDAFRLKIARFTIPP